MPSRFLYLVRHGEASDDGSLTAAGREQALTTGEHLRAVRFRAIRHSPLTRAEQTAELIAGFQPGVPMGPSGLLGDYPPPADGTPAAYTGFLDGFSEDERADGAELASAALARYALPGDGLPGDGLPGDTASSELIVTHNFLIGWFVRHALDGPAWRWLGLNQCHCGITVLHYRTDAPASLISYNQTGHLPAPLRWTGFPPALIPPLH